MAVPAMIGAALLAQAMVQRVPPPVTPTVRSPPTIAPSVLAAVPDTPQGYAAADKAIDQRCAARVAALTARIAALAATLAPLRAQLAQLDQQIAAFADDGSPGNAARRKALRDKRETATNAVQAIDAAIGQAKLDIAAAEAQASREHAELLRAYNDKVRGK